MNARIAVLTVLFALPTIIPRRKKYEMSWLWVLIVLLLFFTMGVFGAMFGAGISNHGWLGIRLYGLIMFEFISVYLVSWWKKAPPQQVGDYVAAPIASLCAGAKVNCLVLDCCWGFIIYDAEMQNPVRFPSAIMEIAMWLGLAVVLVMFEKKKTVDGLLFPIMAIWFGILRYIAGFFRGGTLEWEPFFLWIPAGRFWSLVVVAMGFGLLYYFMRKQLERKPTVKEMLRVCIGKSPVAAQ